MALQEVACGNGPSALLHFDEALNHHRIIGNEEGLATTFSQLGKTLLSLGQNDQAEKCLNNATEHFIKLGNEQGEASVLRLLATLYEERGDSISAIRCLEHTVQIDLRYHLPKYQEDLHRLTTLRNTSHLFP